MFGEPRVSRRAALGFALGAGLGGIRSAGARGRSPVGGRASLRVPFGMASVDPHRLDDPLGALLGDALFDVLYTRDGVPALAEAEPEADGDGFVIRVRRGVTTAEGRPIDARDVAHSLARARRLGARAWLGEVPTPERRGNDALRFATRDAARLVQALSSPLTAVVPIAFDPERPDGTGAFRAERRDGGFALVRNARAARGPALLDEIVIRPAADLASSLRAFEAGTDDVGWLGAGLHAPRPNAKSFDVGSAAWVVLRVGRDAGAWDAPGVMQRILDGLAPAKLTFLGLGAPWRQERDEGWGGPSGDLLVRDDAPYLLEVARTVAALLSRPGHELTPKPTPARDIATRRGKREHLLILDLARPFAPGALGAWTALASVDEPSAATELPKRAPRLAEAPARTLTRTLRVGVVGELRVQGARVPDLALPAGDAGWDLALASRARRPS